MSEKEKIAFYQVHFVYKDGKDLNINMAPEQLNEFFTELNAKKIFWYGKEEQPEMGFWTNIDEVRFIQLRAMKGVEHVEQLNSARAPQDVEAAVEVSKVEAISKQ